MPDTQGTTLNSLPQQFTRMTGEVQAMLHRFPAGKELSIPGLIAERERLAANGYNEQQQDAIMHTFAVHQGLNSAAVLSNAMRPSYAEGQVVAPGNAYTPDTQNTLNPPAPFGHINPPDAGQFYVDLLANKMRVGAEPSPTGYRFPWAGTNL